MHLLVLLADLEPPKRPAVHRAAEGPRRRVPPRLGRARIHLGFLRAFALHHGFRMQTLFVVPFTTATLWYLGTDIYPPGNSEPVRYSEANSVHMAVGGAVEHTLRRRRVPPNVRTISPTRPPSRRVSKFLSFVSVVCECSFSRCSVYTVTLSWSFSRSAVTE